MIDLMETKSNINTFVPHWRLRFDFNFHKFEKNAVMDITTNKIKLMHVPFCILLDLKGHKEIMRIKGLIIYLMIWFYKHSQ